MTSLLGEAMDSNHWTHQIAEQGFAVVPKVILVDRAQAVGDAIVNIPLGDQVRRKRSTYGVRNLLETCPEVCQLAICPEVRGLVTPILGDGCFAVRAIFFDKTVDANWRLCWNQYIVISVKQEIQTPGFGPWSRKAGVIQVTPPAEILSQMLAVRVHLDPNDQHNAPLRVLPGSHTQGWLDDEIDDWKHRVDEVICCVPACGAVLMRPLLLHASGAAEQSRPRRVVHIEFASEELPGELEWNRRVEPQHQS
jgi:hypothetical protein